MRYSHFSIDFENAKPFSLSFLGGKRAVGRGPVSYTSY